MRARSTATAAARVLFVLVLLSAAAAITGCRPDTHPLEASRLDVTIRVEPNGDATIDETIRGRLTPAADAFTRTIASDRADAITLLAVDLDGAPVDVTATPSGGGLRVVWPLDAPDAAEHTFHVRYRAQAATEIVEGRGRLTWPVAPAPRTYRLDVVHAQLELPEGVEIGAGSGMAEAGWQLEPSPGGFVAERSGVGFDPATLVARYPVDLSVVRLPAWQVTADLRSEFWMAFVSGALFILVIGAGVVWIVRFQYPSRPVRDPAAGAWSASLPPAAAARLVTPGIEAADAIRAAVIDVVCSALRAAPGPSAGGAAVTADASATAPWKHEALVVEAAGDARDGQDGPAMVRAAVGVLMANPQAFAVALDRDLVANRLVDPERPAIKRNLRTAGAIVVVFGALCAAVVPFTLGRFGWWAQLLPIATVLVGLLLVVFGWTFQVRSDSGARATAWWRAHGLVRGRAAGALPDLPAEVALAFAVAHGQGRAWMDIHGAGLPEPSRRIAEAALTTSR